MNNDLKVDPPITLNPNISCDTIEVKGLMDVYGSSVFVGGIKAREMKVIDAKPPVVVCGTTKTKGYLSSALGLVCRAGSFPVNSNFVAQFYINKLTFTISTQFVSPLPKVGQTVSGFGFRYGTKVTALNGNTVTIDRPTAADSLDGSIVVFDDHKNTDESVFNADWVPMPAGIMGASKNSYLLRFFIGKECIAQIQFHNFDRSDGPKVLTKSNRNIFAGG